MSAVGSFATLFVVFVSGMGGVMAVLAITTIRRERRRREHLRAYAARLGLFPFTHPVPAPDAARSRRAKLALGGQRGRHAVWVVWHQWVESTGDNSSTTRNLTRYYLWLGPGHPDIELQRRTSIGAFFKPVRGAGTGDAAFDKAILVRPTDGHEHLRVLTPPLREALLSRRLPLFQITDGVLITTYGDVPRIKNLQPRAD